MQAAGYRAELGDLFWIFVGVGRGGWNPSVAVCGHGYMQVGTLRADEVVNRPRLRSGSNGCEWKANICGCGYTQLWQCVEFWSK